MRKERPPHGDNVELDGSIQTIQIIPGHYPSNSNDTHYYEESSRADARRGVNKKTWASASVQKGDGLEARRSMF